MSGTEGSIFVYGTMHCDPAQVHLFEAQADLVVAATRQEPGCLAYHFLLESEEAGRFVTIERWRDHAALQAHMGAAHIAAFIHACGPHIRGADTAVFDAGAPRPLIP
jgi:quinol monooxygenase YgiN